MKNLAKPFMATLIAGLPFLATPVFASAKLPVHFTTSNMVNAIASNNATTEEDKAFTVSLRQVNNSETVRLVIYKNTAKRLTVRLKTADGSLLDSYFTQRQNQQEGKDYNFKDAEEGTYILEVSDGKSTVAKQINLQHVKVQEVAKLNIQ